MARTYRELLVWQKAKALAVHIYRATEQFPKAETYGLTSQIRRAAVSVASNIAEGQGRLTSGEFLHFLGQARGDVYKRQLLHLHVLGHERDVFLDNSSWSRDWTAHRWNPRKAWDESNFEV